MNRLAALLLATVIPLATWAAPAARSENHKSKQRAQRKARQNSLQGCVDEIDGRYVLVNDQTLEPIARLEADGFPQEGLAKYLGHKVSVQGRMISEGAPRVLHVRNVATVSDTCAPAQETH